MLSNRFSYMQINSRNKEKTYFRNAGPCIEINKTFFDVAIMLLLHCAFAWGIPYPILQVEAGGKMLFEVAMCLWVWFSGKEHDSLHCIKDILLKKNESGKMPNSHAKLVVQFTVYKGSWNKLSSYQLIIIMPQVFKFCISVRHTGMMVVQLVDSGLLFAKR